MIKAKRLRLDEDEQFELAKKLHTQSPLNLKQICLNYLVKTWPLWISGCIKLKQNLFINIRKCNNRCSELKTSHRFGFRGHKNLYKPLPNNVTYSKMTLSAT